jgi:hypothetical protein
MVNLNRIILIAVGLLQLCLFSTAVSAANIVVRSDRNPVGLNESFQLVYETEGDVNGDPDFSVLEGLLDILNRSQSSNISIINGSYSSKKNWTLTAMAKQNGKLVLPPVPFGSDKSPSYTLVVNEASQNDAQTKDFFTRVRVNQQKAYVQQQVVITQQLFSAFNLSAYGMGDLKFSGVDVVVEPLGDEKQYQTNLNGQPYVVVEKQFAVFPQKSGALKLEPVLAEGQTGSRSNSFFDPFPRGKVVRARSEGIEIEVMDVPANAKNMSPWLPASDFQLMEQWAENPPKFVQGEPLTRTLSIKAEGLSAAQLPVLPDVTIDGFKQYPDQPILDNIRNDTGLSGYRVEKVAFIPTRAGKITLPAIEIPWWNTKTEKREVARTPQRVVEVVPSPTAMQPAPAVANQDSAPVAAQAGATAEQEAPAAQQSMPEADNSLWMWLAVLSLLGWLVTAATWFLFEKSKKRTTDSSNKTDITIMHKTLYKQVQQACVQQDAAACRSALLRWGRSVFSLQQVKTLADIVRIAPEALGEELKKLDAVLYGESKQQIDFELISKLLREIYQQQNRQSTTESDTLLEPLYK